MKREKTRFERILDHAERLSTLANSLVQSMILIVTLVCAGATAVLLIWFINVIKSGIGPSLVVK